MKSFKMFLLSLSAAALLLASIPAPVADAAGSEKSKIVVKNVKDVDKKLVSKAKKALKPYITGDIEFETVEYNWVSGGKKAPTIRTKAFRTEKYSDGTDQKIWAAAVTIVEETGKIAHIHLDAQYPSLDDSIRKKYKSALKETGRNLAYKDIKIFQVNPDSGTINTLHTPFSIEIDIESGKLLNARYRMKVAEADPKAVQAAQQAGSALTGEKKIAFDYVDREVNDYRNIYSFSESKQDLIISVRAKTNEVESAQWGKEQQTFGSPEEKEKKFKKPMYTDEEAITTMNPLMKKIFGVDLTGYQVEVDKDWYKFSKKGSPTVSGVINEKGKVFLVFQSNETK
ncbi:hypothetical protein [Paenibacillus dendritiformis]|uniref:hypothetical protein n=1 Tax=Paenibacillus dendritiformis TaxID=130049 RepID=UPI00387E04AD